MQSYNPITGQITNSIVRPIVFNTINYSDFRKCNQKSKNIAYNKRQKNIIKNNFRNNKYYG